MGVWLGAIVRKVPHIHICDQPAPTATHSPHSLPPPSCPGQYLLQAGQAVSSPSHPPISSSCWERAGLSTWGQQQQCLPTHLPRARCCSFLLAGLCPVPLPTCLCLQGTADLLGAQGAGSPKQKFTQGTTFPKASSEYRLFTVGF